MLANYVCLYLLYYPVILFTYNYLIENREDSQILNTEKEVTLYNPADSASSGFYKDFALDCSRQQIAVDLFLFPSAFIDVATLGCLPQITGIILFY